ncbi:uncharacterized protein LOC119004469 isoform X2 [Acanthopagrus latus]|uniref:uncharacterized protein LOC119004469 isoform X2 n=1 Tax=Acanthopagrus latus TaxID=8177 RepID=UPI00187CF753|nr:uncharacterized protein LOC119004469 isoform X2 [Acanthopagrus latus]
MRPEHLRRPRVVPPGLTRCEEPVLPVPPREGEGRGPAGKPDSHPEPGGLICTPASLSTTLSFTIPLPSTVQIRWCHPHLNSEPSFKHRGLSACYSGISLCYITQLVVQFQVRRMLHEGFRYFRLLMLIAKWLCCQWTGVSNSMWAAIWKPSRKSGLIRLNYSSHFIL